MTKYISVLRTRRAVTSAAMILVAAIVAAVSSGHLRGFTPQDVGTWASLGTIADSRTGAAAVALPDGRTLISGGTVADGTPSASVVILDPATRTSTRAGSMLEARVGHTATLLKDGRVLIAGGFVSGVASADVELFDPASGASVLAGSMTQPRAGHAAALLADDKVLIAGGVTTDSVVLDAAEVFDAAASSSAAIAARMSAPRVGASATTLIQGEVLIAGGSNASGDLSTAEVYEPWSESFVPSQTQLSVARSGHSAVLLPHNNSVLIAGGTSAGAAVATSDLFLPAAFPDPYSYGMGSFAPTGSLSGARSGAVSGPAGDNGLAFVAGGGTAEAEQYRFATVKTDKDDYAPGEKALITGSGWLPNAEVTLTFQEDPAVHDDYVLTVPTDAEGNFSWDQWAPEAHDLNVRFYLMASDSRVRAQVTFTDGNQFTVTVSPTSVAAGSANDFAFSFTSTNGGNPGATLLTLTVPSGWTAPQTGAGAGQVTVVGGTCAATLGGTAGSVITITQPSGGCKNNETFTVNYKQATAPASAGTSSFDTKFGTTTIATPTVTVTGTVAPTKLAFTNTAFTGAVNACFGPFVVQSQNASNTATNVTSATTVNLSTNGVGAFYTDNACSTSTITTRAIGIGVNSTGNFYYKPTAVGTGSHTLTAADAANVLTSATQVQIVTSTSQSALTVTVPSPGVYNQTYTLTTSGGNGTGAVSYTVGASDACTVAADQLTITKGSGGTCVVSATKAGDGNFNPISSAATSVTLAKAAQGTVSVAAPATATFGQTGLSAVGSGGNGTGAFSYSAASSTACSVNGTSGALTISSGAGTCSVTATRAGDANYEDSAASAAATVTVGKATATVNVTGYSGSYDGAAHGASGTATGLAGADLSGGLSLGATFTNAPGGTAHWTFTGGPNYADQSGDVQIVISKITPSVTVSFASGSLPYDGNPHPATANVTLAALPEDGTVTITYTPAGVPTNAGSYTASAHFASSNSNFNDADSTVAATLTITKVDATVDVVGGTFPYDGAAHGATGTAKGVSGVALSGLALGDTFTNVPGGTAHWTFTDATGNYNDASGTAAIVITKVDANVEVVGGTFPYDGLSHGATGTAKGVGGVALSGLSLGDAFTNVPGGTAHWTFTDATGNYNDASGTAAIVITKADATIDVTGGTFPYDGAAHGATGTAKGIGGIGLTGLNLGNTFTNVPGGTAHWTFTDTTGNYNDASGTAAIVITKADATIAVTGYTGVYDGAAHGATGTAKGVGGVTLAGLTLGVSFTNVPGGTANWTFTDTTGNYNDATGTAAIVITKADATIVVNGYTGVYDGAAHGATGSAKGLNGVPLSGLILGSSFTNVPGGTANWIFTDSTGNYNNASGSAAIVITKANPIVQVTGYTGMYDGLPHGATGTATGVGGVTLAGLTLGASFTNVPGGTASWNFTDVTGNYNNAGGTSSIVINKAPLLVSADNKTKLLNAVNPPLTATITGFQHAETLATSGVSGEAGLSTTAVTNSAVGPYPITAAIGTLAAQNYAFTFGNGTLTVLYRWDGYLQPINDTAHDVITMSNFKLGQTIPAKFDLKDVNGNVVVQATSPTFNYARVGSCGSSSLDALDLNYPPSTLPVYILTGGHYQYNWSTKGMAQGLYRIFATLADSTTQSVDICLTR